MLPARLVSFAKRHELDVRIIGFRTLYPGDLGATTVTNKDGIISRDEALALANDGAEALGRSAFPAADENHDHFLSAAEFQDAVAGSAKTVFAMFDSNKDGQPTEAEASAAMNAAGLRLGMPKLAQKD